MNRRVLLILMCVLWMPSVASSQEWIKWDSPQQQPPQDIAQPQKNTSDKTPQEGPPQTKSVATVAGTTLPSPVIDKAECDAEVARTYPVNLWAPGLGKKRDELFAACMTRRSNSEDVLANSPPTGKVECDAEVARTYPVNLWAPGLKEKRQELFAACMARPNGPAVTVGSAPPNKAECDAEVARAYPVNLWAPGLGNKRKELFAACMAR